MLFGIGVVLGTIDVVAPAVAVGAHERGAAFVTNVPGFAAAAVAIGLFIAPLVVTGYLAAERLAPAHTVTEASVWTNTALNLGAAIANAGTGALITGLDTTAAMLTAGMLVTATALCTHRAQLLAGDA